MASNELKVGVTVLLAVVVLGAGIVFLKEYRLHGRMNEWKVGFPHVGGLAGGDPVLVNGVKEGAVEEIYLQHGEVVATLRVRKHVILTSSSTVTIVSQGLMGERIVSVDLGPPAPAWPADSVFPGQFSSGIPEVMGKIGPTIETVDSLLMSLKRVMDDLHASGALSRALRNADRASSQVAQILDENRAALRQSLEDFHAAAAALRHVTDTRGKTLEASIDKFSSASARLDKITANFEETSAKLHAAADRLERGEGTLGRLSKDQALYDEMHRAAKDLDDLVKDIREHPSRYLKVSLF
ncbi:MAG TPA: MlaD family protein [Candidatus Saccharimonadales bacterium]|nr:MlaD family protein [Candidatus Saccharimonadales bacterium]